MSIGYCCSILLLILFDTRHIIHRTRMCHFAIHFGPANKLLLLRLSSTVIIGQCTECLTRCSNNITTTSWALMIWIYCCLVRLELMVIYNLMIFQVSFILLLTILLAIITIALVLDSQFVQILPLTVQRRYGLISRSCGWWSNSRVRCVCRY